MGLSKAREVILKKVRLALTRQQPTVPEPNFTADVFSRSEEKDLSIVFAENFIKTKGEFIFCENEKEFATSFKKFVESRNLENIFSWEPEVEPMLIKSKVPFNSTQENFLDSQAG